MGHIYELHEARLLQCRESTSAADSLILFIGPCPAGKFWTILNGRQHCSVSESRLVWWVIYNATYGVYPFTNPTTRTVSTVLPNCLTTEGLEINLFPGELIGTCRDIATAGSTMNMGIRFIESDLPYYSYEEPLNKIVKQSQRHGSVYRSSGGISPGGSKPDAGRPGGEGGGGRESV